ncbi:hypothetical protein [Nonomuraea typhae]|uniref:hypothetical protein n=1 Tax=Nonomuraea typhae TaxID=2603600 RepID=UPI0012F8AC1F|nr:hypothetical protein [Nonomuraea typhae]
MTVSRWRKAVVASSVGLAASAVFVVSSPPSQADSLVATYLCKDGVAGSGVELEASIEPKIVGGLLQIMWRIEYRGNPRFGSPGFFAAGSDLSLHGEVDLTGAWNGELRPEGRKKQARLSPGDTLELPEGLSKSATLDEPGKIRIKPGPMEVRFTPVESDVTVNNDDPRITYTADWTYKPTPGEGDHHDNLHQTTTKNANATFKFVGTGVEYIGRRETGLGKVQVRLDGQPTSPQDVDPSTPGPRESKYKLWSWTSSPLDYREHTLEITNLEDKQAYLDAIKVITGKMAEPPQRDKATCTRTSGKDFIEIVVPGAPTDTPTTPTPTTTPPTTPPPGNPPPGNGGGNGNGNNNENPLVPVGPGRVSVNTSTPRASATPTTTRYVKAAAQVLKTPKGGVETGEAPEGSGRPYALIGGGAVLLMLSATGGLMVRRRRAGHAGGAK